MRFLRSVFAGAGVLVGLAVISSCAHHGEEPSAPQATACQLEKVGGAANPCHCSHRIEP